MRSIVCAAVFFVLGSVLQANEAEELIEASGIPGGLVVHIDCGDGRTTSGLRVNEQYLVHGLDRDPAKVATAREYIKEQ